MTGVSLIYGTQTYNIIQSNIYYICYRVTDGTVNFISKIPRIGHGNIVSSWRGVTNIMLNYGNVNFKLRI